MKTLRFIGVALLAVVLSVNLASCSDDDEEDVKNDLFSIITSGAWEQDGDDDIFVVSKDGTGFEYNSHEAYKLKEKTGYSFTWEYKNNIVSVELAAKYKDGVKTEERYDYIEMTVLSYDKNKIIFKIENSDDDFSNSPWGFENDTWTWTRFE